LNTTLPGAVGVRTFASPRNTFMNRTAAIDIDQKNKRT